MICTKPASWIIFRRLLVAFEPTGFQPVVIQLAKKKRIWILWAFLWIIFWPNTFYIATDVVHFTGDAFFHVIKGTPYIEQTQVVYSKNLLLWSKGIVIVLGILYSIMNGIKSEITFEDIIIIHYGKIRNMLFRVICSVLGGIGIYIGRFLRLNSWNIFNPIKIATNFQLSEYDSAFAYGFIGISSAFIFCILSFAKPFSNRPAQ